MWFSLCSALRLSWHKHNTGTCNSRAKCFNDAEMHLVGTDTQARRIERSQLDLSRAMVQMRNAKKELKRLITEGRRRLAAERDRQHTSLFRDVWEDMSRFGETNYEGAIQHFKRIAAGMP